MDDRKICSELLASKSLLAFYHKSTNSFQYHPDLLDYLGHDLSGKLLWDYLLETDLLPSSETEQIRQICRDINDVNSFFARYFRPAGFALHTFIFVCQGDVVTIAFKDLTPDIAHTESRMSDELTGLMTRKSYCAKIDEIIAKNPGKAFAVYYFDLLKFKAINDRFGYAEGDKVLIHIANTLNGYSPLILASCRVGSDHFSLLADVTDVSPDAFILGLLEEIESYDLPFDINCNAGAYLVQHGDEHGRRMLDKAMMAQNAIKGNFTRKLNYYTDKLRDEMLSEQEITGLMNTALEEGQFLVYYQPQYNHATGMIVGAEALVRWLHPERGLVPPAHFIPMFEKNGFIVLLDLYVFEQTCRFLRRSQDAGIAIVPISVNFSVDDIYAHDFVDKLEAIREKHGVLPRHLRIELTERLLINSSKTVNTVLHQLHERGYLIELDDFGSGYSSLNTLKDLDVDIIKLDMMFLSGPDGSGRGGTILSSVINMAKWLKMPVIAEGVETREQADFLRSIGCNYMQGYLYARPLPENEYEKLLSASKVGSMLPPMELIDTMNAANFWDPTSQETLIFNNFVGGAAILRYDRITGETEVLRVNQKYLRELGMNLSEQEIIHGEHDEFDSKADQLRYLATLDRAIDTMEEQECETWRKIHSSCCGDETICLRSSLRLIGSGGNQFLFYEMIRNVTAEKVRHQDMLDTERRFKMASEQVNIYFWEYTVATREMRPCFRCMRDLGLPPLLRNYPDSAIEAGIFPPEVADMYRDWHVQVANGVKELEAIIPLTMNRVPFHVRYTTEFDENGNPIKAYGSAALVVD